MSRKAKLVKLEFKEKYQRLLTQDSDTSGLKVGHVTLTPNESIGSHTTGDREEVIVVLKGKGEAKIGKEKCIDIRTNEVLYIPPKTEHDIKNKSSEVLDYIFITSGAQ